MSTRGCVAIIEGDTWRGIYNHFDSYPTGLGKELWEYLHQDGLDIHEFANGLLRYDDWRNFRGGGVCEYCGKVGKGQPHSISGVICIRDEYKTKGQMRDYYQALPGWQGRDDEVNQMIEREWQIRGNIKRTGYPDPETLYHQHGELADKITSDNADPLFIEWVYALDPVSKTMSIFSGISVPKLNGGQHGTFIEASTIQRLDGTIEKTPAYYYVHKLVAVVKLDGEEPNWEDIEELR